MSKLKPTHGTQLQGGHPLAQGLVGCYLMNEAGGTFLFDSSGNGNHGTAFSGGTPPSWVATPYGPGLYFHEDAESYVEITMPVEHFADQQFTCFAVGYFGGGNNQVLLTDLAPEIVHWIESSTRIGHTFFFNGTRADADKCSGFWGSVASVIAPDLYVHLYENGVLEASSAAAATWADPNDDWYIGIHSNASSSSFRDTLVCLYVYNRALTTNEIASLDADPWQIFENDELPLFTTSGTPATTSSTTTTTSTTSSSTTTTSYQSTSTTTTSTSSTTTSYQSTSSTTTTTSTTSTSTTTTSTSTTSTSTSTTSTSTTSTSTSTTSTSTSTTSTSTTCTSTTCTSTTCTSTSTTCTSTTCTSTTTMTGTFTYQYTIGFVEPFESTSTTSTVTTAGGFAYPWGVASKSGITVPADETVSVVLPTPAATDMDPYSLKTYINFDDGYGIFDGVTSNRFDDGTAVYSFSVSAPANAASYSSTTSTTSTSTTTTSTTTTTTSTTTTV